MPSFIWKPFSSGGLNPGGLSIVLKDVFSGANSAKVVDAQGNVLEDLRLAGGKEVGTKFYSTKPGSAFGNNVKVIVNYSDGKSETYDIPNGAGRFEGPLGDSSPGSAPDTGGSGIPGPFAPIQTPNGLGFAPIYLGGQFPSPALINYSPIQTAPYQFTDPIKFAKQFGKFNRGEEKRNYQLAKNFALQNLDLELQGLEKFVPATANLQRQQVAQDNAFNQGQRTSQINTVLPEARGDLAAQRQRALDFASGRLPSSIEDRAFEVGVRSQAADQSTASGIGASSVAGRKLSDLLSAKERVTLSQYGDQLLTNNLGTKANLYLSPLEQANAGSQVRIMPEVGAGRTASQFMSELNQNTLLNPANALQTQVQQNQFTTGLEQQNRQFNASNQLGVDQFNANNQNNFALQKFSYDVGYAGTAAGVSQTAANTALQLQQQQQALELYKEMLAQAQKAQQAGAVAQGIGALLPAVKGIVDTIGSLFKSLNLGGTSNTVQDPTGAPGSSNTGTGSDTNADGNLNNDVGGSEPTPLPTGPVDTDADGNLNNDTPTSTEDSGTQVDTGADDSFFLRSASTTSPLSKFSLTQKAAAQKSADTFLNTVGVSKTQTPTYSRLAAYDSQGKPVFQDPKLADSKDTSVGSTTIKTLKTVLDPLGVLKKEDVNALDKIALATDDVAFVSQLNDLIKRGDKKAFANALLQRFQKPIVENLIKDERNQAGLNSALSLYSLANSWDTMSPAQKALSIANIGISTYKFATGENLAHKIIVPATETTPGLNVGTALQLANTGYNIYDLARNWNQYSTIAKVAGSTSVAANIVDIAAQQGFLKQAAAQGAKTGLAESGLTAGSALTTVAGAATVALGAQQIYKNWGIGGPKGRLAEGLGGATVAAGLYTLGYINPAAAGAIVATSFLAGSIKTGKSGDQKSRDGQRSLLQHYGLADKDYQLTLPDGSKFDIGVDGHGQQHDFRYADRALAEHKGRKLNAWDVDYTNDLDYASSMGSIALMRLLNGGKSKAVDQMGGQLTNALISNIKTKDFTPASFNQLMENLRGTYSKAGIKTKNDANELAKAAYDEGRITQIDLAQMQQAFNMMYDGGSYTYAKNLFSGRNSGLEVAAKNPDINLPPQGSAVDPGFTKHPPIKFPTGGDIDPGFTRPGSIQLPKPGSSIDPGFTHPGTNIQIPSGSNIDPGFSQYPQNPDLGFSRPGFNAKTAGLGPGKVGAGAAAFLNKSKDDIRKRNLQKYLSMQEG